MRVFRGPPLFLLAVEEWGVLFLRATRGIAPEAIVIVDHHAENLSHFSGVHRFFSVGSLPVP